MNLKDKEIEISSPKNQLKLFGYKNYFKFFINLYEKGKLPNSILFSGPKGIGKATFAYHFINYLLSKNEENKYSINHLSIKEDNSSYKLLLSNVHPNFFLVDNDLSEKNININKVRDLIRFLNKTAYSKNIKIVLIDNTENLNLNSSNALLKSIEEPTYNTFFFIIHNSGTKILETLKSRCTEFKFFLNNSEKKDVFMELRNQYNKNLDNENIIDQYSFDTPGNLIKYFSLLTNYNILSNNGTLECIFSLIDMCMNSKDAELFYYLSILIDKYYNELCLANSDYVIYYTLNHSKILNQLNDLKRFNLDKKNILNSIKEILRNESR